MHGYILDQLTFLGMEIYKGYLISWDIINTPLFEISRYWLDSLGLTMIPAGTITPLSLCIGFIVVIIVAKFVGVLIPT